MMGTALGGVAYAEEQYPKYVREGARERSIRRSR